MLPAHDVTMLSTNEGAVAGSRRDVQYFEQFWWARLESALLRIILCNLSNVKYWNIIYLTIKLFSLNIKTMKTKARWKLLDHQNFASGLICFSRCPPEVRDSEPTCFSRRPPGGCGSVTSMCRKQNRAPIIGPHRVALSHRVLLESSRPCNLGFKSPPKITPIWTQLLPAADDMIIIWRNTYNDILSNNCWWQSFFQWKYNNIIFSDVIHTFKQSKLTRAPLFVSSFAKCWRADAISRHQQQQWRAGVWRHTRPSSPHSFPRLVCADWLICFDSSGKPDSRSREQGSG